MLGALACDSRSQSEGEKSESAPAASSSIKTHRQLFVPPDEEAKNRVNLSGNEHQAGSVSFGPTAPVGNHVALGPCPAEMVLIANAFCIDRFEASMVDVRDARKLSPHYPPSKRYTSSLFERWARQAGRSGQSLDESLSVPPPPNFQLLEDFAPRARSLRSVLPAGYLSRGLAEAACKNAGKRLCRRDEWVQACRGQDDTQFPYGPEYQDGVCNVHRKSHPARLIHGDASRNHLDPRLGLAADDEGPLLHRTGETPACMSRWGADGVYDMVGNLDEWIAEPTGSFLGGFYSRGTKAGCSASIDSHDPGYLDYSLGTRCCQDL